VNAGGLRAFVEPADDDAEMTNRRARWRRAALGVLAATTVGFLVWMLTTDLDSSAAVASVIGLLVAAAALAVAVVQAFPVEARPVDPAALAKRLGRQVRSQWIGEAEARWLRNERDRVPVLPLEWFVTARNVAADDGARPLAPSGRIEGRFDTAAATLAGVYRSVPSGRMVMIGEPGAGKTVLAMLLTTGLLPESRLAADAPPPSADDPVPVLLSASSWDPVSQTLDDWIVRALALSYYGGSEEEPAVLLRAGLLLPVIDGLDEIPESARRSAVHAISREVTRGRPVVVTCRSAEYEDTIKGGAPMLHRAPVVEMAPVCPADAIAYLRSANTSDCDTWEKVYVELGRHAEPGPLAEALTTPLMISLASAVYGGRAGDPQPLLDPVGIACRHDVEDHLLDRSVATAFEAGDRRSWQPEVTPSRWNAQQAERWLVFLAEYLHTHRERELAWWRMSDRLLPAWAVPVICMTVGLGLGEWTVAIMAVLETLDAGRPDWDAATISGLVFGGGFVVLSMFIWHVIPPRPPGRTPSSLHVAIPRLLHGFAVGFALPAIPGAVVMAGVALMHSVSAEWSIIVGREYITAIVTIIGCSALSGLATAAESCFSAPSELSERPSPAQFLAHDRRSSIIGASVAGAVAAVGAFPTILAADTLGYNVGTSIMLWLSGSAEPDGLDAMATDAPDLTKTHDVLVLLLPSLLIGTAAGLLIFLTRAWPRYVALRLTLAVRRQLPWNLPRFLGQARERGLLRESGGVYQFRHARLQERLAGRPAESQPIARSAPLLKRRLRAALATATAVVVLAATATVLAGRAMTAEFIPLAGATEEEVQWLDSLRQRSSMESGVALNRDGSVLAIAAGRKIMIWELDLGALSAARRAWIDVPNTEEVSAVALSQDGMQVAVSVTNYFRSDQNAFSSVYVFTASGQLTMSWNFAVPRTLLAFSPDGSRLAVTAERDQVEFLNIDDRNDRRAVPGGAPGGSVGKNSALTALSGSSVAVGLEITDRPRSVRKLGDATAPGSTTTHHTSPITAIWVGNDGTVVTGSESGTVRFHPGDAMGESMHLTSERLGYIQALAVHNVALRSVVVANERGVEFWTAR
jgi:hypothetical protein